MDSKLRLAIIYGSDREGRFCDTIVAWILDRLAGDPRMTVDVVDPRSIASARRGWGDLTLAVEARRNLDAADAFIVATPEYNHGYPAGLKQFIDGHKSEWQAKPVAFVSYGGISGGLRAVEQLRQVFAELHAVGIRDTVSFANAQSRFNSEGEPADPIAAAAAISAFSVLVERLVWWAKALRNARIESPYDRDRLAAA